MFKRIIIPGDFVFEKIEPYNALFEALALPPENIVGYAIDALHHNDYEYLSNKINEDYLSWGGGIQNECMPESRELKKAIDACIDAIGDVVETLEPEIYGLFGITPKSLVLNGTLGRDLILGVITNDSPETSPHTTESCVV